MGNVSVENCGVLSLLIKVLVILSWNAMKVLSVQIMLLCISQSRVNFLKEVPVKLSSIVLTLH